MQRGTESARPRLPGSAPPCVAGRPAGKVNGVRIFIPDGALVVLAGPAGCGKSTFAARHFRPTEIVSSDWCRAAVSDSQDNQAATRDAFEVLHLIVDKRLRRRRRTVVDATNVAPASRRPLLRLARTHRAPAVAIVFDLPVRDCVGRNVARPDRGITADVIRRHSARLRNSLLSLRREGFDRVFVLHTAEEVDAVRIHRVGRVRGSPLRA